MRAVAVKAIILHEGRVLVLQQAPDPRYANAGRFHPPGGMVESGERLVDALRREVFEETGLRIEPVRLLDAAQWSAKLDGVDHDFIGLFYECRLAGNKQEPVFDRENTNHRWVVAADLAGANILEPSNGIIARVLSAQPAV